MLRKLKIIFPVLFFEEALDLSELRDPEQYENFFPVKKYVPSHISKLI